MKIRNAASFVDGAEDFWYLCGQPLINYGSVIAAGMVQSAKQKSTFAISKSSLTVGEKRKDYVFEPQRDVIDNTSIERDAHIRDNSSAGTTVELNEDATERSRVAPRASAFRQNPDSRIQTSTLKRTLLPNLSPINRESDDRSEMRAQIRDMRIDTSKDPGILSWTEVAGLDRAKACLEEFSASFQHFPHLVATLRHQSASGILLFGPQGTGKTLLGTCGPRQAALLFKV